jgi:hypothetical protein
MASSSNTEYIPLVPIGGEGSVPQNGTYHEMGGGTWLKQRRKAAKAISYPVILLLLYLILTLPSKRRAVLPPEYLSHIGRSALETTLSLPTLQYQFPHGEGADYERREKVKEALKRNWYLYVQEAWGWDEVRPVHGGGRDTRSGPLRETLTI